MTVPEQPSDPAVPVPPTPEPSPEEAAAQQAAAEKAAAEAALTEQIRALAAEIAKQSILDFDPATVRKGQVKSIQDGAPPTVTVTISGAETVEVPGVRYYEHYIPEVDDTVHLLKQGTDLVAIGKIAGQQSDTGWTTPGLATGFTSNGNANGPLQVRRVWDHGEWRICWKGSVARSSGSTIIAAGILDAKYRPTVKRTMIAARQIAGAVAVQIDFNIDGSVVMFGGTATGASDGAGTTSEAGLHSHAGGTGDAGGHAHGGSVNDAGSHAHGGSVGGAGLHSHGGNTGGITSGSAGGAHTHDIVQVNDHSHSVPSVGAHGHSINEVGHHSHSIGEVGHHTHTGGGSNHTHAVTDPLWISFNGIEFYAS
jgi:hypothetical protein